VVLVARRACQTATRMIAVNIALLLVAHRDGCRRYGDLGRSSGLSTWSSIFTATSNLRSGNPMAYDKQTSQMLP
jgi:hypothetical protein